MEIREPLYDTIDIAAAESPIGTRKFFAAVQGKSSILTNLRQNSQLETANSFRVQGLALDVQNFSAANFQAVPLILEHSSLTFRSGEKKYWEGPVRFAAGRIDNEYAASSGVDFIYQQHGFPATAGVILVGKHSIDINPLQSFDCTLYTDGMTVGEVAASTPAANTKLRYVCSLKGLRRRPVQ